MKAIHKVSDVVILGLQSLTRHIVRSLLTIMGILFGVWSVIAMLALNEGMAMQAEMELQKLGSDNLIIESKKPSADSQGASSSDQRMMFYGLTNSHVSLLRDIPGVVRAIVILTQNRDAIYGIKRTGTLIIGTEPAYLEVMRLKLVDSRSRFITDADILRRRNVCVITKELATRLFAYEEPLGKTVRLGDEPFRVVGVLERPAYVKSSSASQTSAGQQVFVPLSTHQQRFGLINNQARPMERVTVNQVILNMADDDAVIGGAMIARALLERYCRDQAEVTVPLELIEQMKAQRRLWNIMFFAIASVSLLVGGIGIMNIMLASVTERTREIGIRRALGAKQRDVVVQFLVESVTLTMVGGLTGILIGAVAVPMVVRSLLDMQAIVRGTTLLVPFVMAVAVGLGSGIYPALRAARLDPIVALRHE